MLGMRSIDRRLYELWRCHVLLDGWKFLKSLGIVLKILKVIQATLFQFQVDVKDFIENKVWEGNLPGKSKGA